MRIGPIFLSGAAVLSAWAWWDGRPVSRPPGMQAPEDPQQTNLEKDDRPFSWKGYRMIPLARYAVRARVLSRERYWVDPGSDLAPVDLALGWGPMSDSSVLGGFSIGQSGRWYHWTSETMPVPAEVVVAHSANTHIIPADPLVRRVVLGAKEGDVVALEGYLVRVEGPKGFTWMSSLSRTDTGGGSCELMFVKEARREPR